MNMQYNFTTKSGAFAPPDLSKRWASRPAAVWQADPMPVFAPAWAARPSSRLSYLLPPELLFFVRLC